MAIRKEQKSGSSIIYLIDEEQGTVTAKIPVMNAIDTTYKDCYKQGIIPQGIPDFVMKEPRKYFIGTAKCAPTDIFDVEIGKKLASARALKKFYEFKFKTFRACAEEYNKQFNALEDCMNYSWLAAVRFTEVENKILMGE